MVEGASLSRARAARRRPAPTTPDPIEIAMEAVANEGGDSPARSLLINQNRLLKWQIAGARASYWLRMALGAAAVALVVGLGVWARQASQENGLIIEAFETPPDLAEKGLSGKVLATALQDRLNQMQVETVSGEESRAVSNRWSGDIRVVIPQTGVSIGEIDRLLRDWLGHRTHVSGEVFRMAPGELTLSVRAGETPAVRVQGAEPDIEALVGKAAESVYGATQPVRYGTWLQQQGRLDEALATWKTVARRGEPRERAMALYRLGGTAGDYTPDDRAQMLKDAHRLDPSSTTLAGTLASSEYGRGHASAGLKLNLEAERLTARDPGLSEQGRRYSFYVNRSNRELWLGAALDSLADAQRQAEQTSAEETVGLNRLLDAEALAGIYDVAAARRVEAQQKPPPASAPQFQRAGYDNTLARARARQAMALQDWDAAAEQYEVMRAGLGQYGFDAQVTMALHAEALARAGRLAEADQLLAANPPDCYQCLLGRAEVALVRRDWAGAERWLKEADRQAPEFPQAPLSRARMRLARGDAAGAVEAAKSANKRSPHFADPLEVWGEALMARGDFGGASVRFAQASNYAPRWARLHIRWGEALARQGKAAEAKAKFAAAAGMDLTPVDRADLARLQGAR